MAEAERDGGKGTKRSYDAVIVGGSLAGCAAATMLGRAGARVAVLEKSPTRRRSSRSARTSSRLRRCRRWNGWTCSSR